MCFRRVRASFNKLIDAIITLTEVPLVIVAAEDHIQAGALVPSVQFSGL